jgi:hypothetical protein
MKSFEGSQIALSSCYLYYCWENINGTTLRNNTFSILWPELTTNADGSALTTPIPSTQLDIVMPDGLYEIDSINKYLQYYCVENNLFLIDNGTGQYVYFLELMVNATRYKIQFNSYALPAYNNMVGYTQPAGGFCSGISADVPSTGAFPTLNTQCPGWYFPANFSEIVGQFGYTPSDWESTKQVSVSDFGFPSSKANVSFLSDDTPAVQPISCIFLNLDLINNEYSSPSTLVYPIFPKSAQFGELINVEPPAYAWNMMQPGNHSQLTAYFTTAKGELVKLLDPDVTITLVISDHQDSMMDVAPTVGTHQSSNSNTVRLLRHPQNTDSFMNKGGNNLLGRKKSY